MKIGLFSRRKDNIQQDNSKITNYHRNVWSNLRSSLEWLYIQPDATKRRNMRKYNGYAIKVIENLTDYSTMGRFDIEGVDPDLLSDYQNQFWSAYNECIKMEKETGLGLMVKYEPGETIEDMVFPWIHEPGDLDEIRYFVPDSNEVSPAFKPAKFLSLKEIDRYWRWSMNNIHVSRIHFFQTRPDPRKADFRGYSILDGGWLGFLVLEKLAFGSLNRSEIWAVKEILQKLSGGGMFTDSTQTNKMMDSFFRENVIRVDSKDDYVWLEDPVGSGEEIQSIAIKFISARTDIGESIFWGNQKGGVKGSEHDLTMWGSAITKDQSKITPLAAEILKEDYGLEFRYNDIDWNINFYTSPERELQIRILRTQAEAIEKNPDLAFQVKRIQKVNTGASKGSETSSESE